MLWPYFSGWRTQRLNSGRRRSADCLEEMVLAPIDPMIVFAASGCENDLPERLKNSSPFAAWHTLSYVWMAPKRGIWPVIWRP